MLEFLRILRALALFGVFLLPMFTWAQSTATGTRYFARHPATGNEFAAPDNPFSSAAAACNRSYQAAVSQWGLVGSPSVTGLTCTVTGTTNNGASPFNYSYTIRTDTGPIVLACPSAGSDRSINLTLGYTHDPSGDTSATRLDIPGTYMAIRSAGSMCASGGGSTCSVQIDTATPPSAVWISAAPNAQGLYRVSVDQRVTYTGTSCTPNANEKVLTDSSDAGPACDGSFGTVNGKPVCVPSDMANRNKVQGTTGTGNVPRQVGNPTAGSNGGLPVGSRTPSGGTGNNDGGPTTPLDGSPAPLNQPLPNTPVGTVTGSIDVEVDVETCGLPGKPPCKMDETGTPDGVPEGVYGPKVDAVADEIAGNRGTIAGDSDKSFFSSWNLFFSAPPVVACEPVALPEHRGVSMGELNPCPVVDGVRTVMAYIWALAALYLCLRMVRQVI